MKIRVQNEHKENADVESLLTNVILLQPSLLLKFTMIFHDPFPEPFFYPFSPGLPYRHKNDYNICLCSMFMDFTVSKTCIPPLISWLNISQHEAGLAVVQ